MFNHKSGKFININGAKIYYEELGDKTKPVLVMLHGGLEDIQELNPLVSYLFKVYHIIGIDSRGHGKSTLGEKKLSYKVLQEDVEKVLEYLNIQKVSILGFSDGGIVACKIAASSDIKVEKLITIGASWTNDDVDALEEICKGLDIQKAKSIFSKTYERYEKLNEKPDFENFMNKVIEMWLDRSKDSYPNDSVENITADTLVLRGDDDFLVPLKSLVKLKEKIKNFSFMNIAFADHKAYEKQPQVVEHIVKEFLNIK